MLSLNKVTYRISGRLIFEDASATIMEGWKVGLVGPNGAGKSTLFKLIANELHADGGEISLSDRFSMGMVRQDLPDDDTPLLDVVLAADTERAALLAEAETSEDSHRLAEVYERLLEIDAYAAPSRASIIMGGLGFKESQLQDPISSLSGGWKMRVALAAALFRQPDLLLLDEPTNHLDLEAVMWLEGYLASYPKTLIIISHDRELLNKCADHILHLENKALTAYTGNYDTFERERAERRGLQQKMHEKQMAQREHMQAFINRFKAKASKARQAQSRMKALEKMDIVDAVMAERGMTFHFPKPDELPPPIVSLDNASAGYAKAKPILAGLTERIAMDDRIALLGANGNGKSTLIKLIAAELAPLAGEVSRSNKLRIGYFSQHQADQFDMSETPYQTLMRLMPGKKESEVRAKLGQFKFGRELADNRIGSLSGGEKSRLLFAIMTLKNPHLLLLDEPTNHLDMDTREGLVQALNQFEGAVIIVSHDPSMVERVADRLWLVHGGKCQPFEGDLEEYRRHVIEQRRAEKKADRKASAAVAEEAPKPSKADLKEKRKQHPGLHAEAQKAEKDLSRLTSKKKELETLMGASDFYDDAGHAQDTQHRYGRILSEIETAEAVWLAAQEAFDAAP